jgi:hypothetical protein
MIDDRIGRTAGTTRHHGTSFIIMTSSCSFIGTKEIYIQSNKRDGDSDIVDRNGIIAIWHRSHEQKIDSILDDGMDLDRPMSGIKILVTDFITVYGVMIDDCNISDGHGFNNDFTKLASVTDSMLHGDQCTYMYSRNTSIELNIENLKVDFTLMPIGNEKTQVYQITEPGPEDNNSTANLVMIMNTLHYLHKDVKKFQDQSMRWKYAANHRDEKLQNENNTLAESFLTLYQKVQDELHTCRQELEEEKRKWSASFQQNRQHNTSESSAILDNKEIKKIWDDEGHDFVHYDADEVDQLAKGPTRGRRTARKDLARESEESVESYQRAIQIKQTIAPYKEDTHRQLVSVVMKPTEKTTSLSINQELLPNPSISFGRISEKIQDLPILFPPPNPASTAEEGDDDSDSGMSAVLL